MQLDAAPYTDTDATVVADAAVAAHVADASDPHAAAGYLVAADVSGSYAPIDSRGRLSASAYPNTTQVVKQGAIVGSTTSVDREGNPSFAFLGGTNTQLYSVDSDGGWHTGHTGTGASAQAGWVSAALAVRLEQVQYLDIRFRYDSLSMSDNHRCFHGFTAGTPAYSTPADEFDTAFACLSALAGTDTTWKLRTRTASGSVTSVDTGVAVAQGVIYRARLRYSGGSVYATMSADGGAWSSEVSTALTLPTAQALRVTSYARVASPSVGVELGNAAWSLVHVRGGV